MSQSSFVKDFVSMFVPVGGCTRRQAQQEVVYEDGDSEDWDCGTYYESDCSASDGEDNEDVAYRIDNSNYARVQMVVDEQERMCNGGQEEQEAELMAIISWEEPSSGPNAATAELLAVHWAARMVREETLIPANQYYNNELDSDEEDCPLWDLFLPRMQCPLKSIVGYDDMNESMDCGC